MISEETLRNWFNYHPPHYEDEAERYKRIRQAGHAMALQIFENTPHGADQTAAIRKVREAVMTANMAIACEDGNNG